MLHNASKSNFVAASSVGYRTSRTFVRVDNAGRDVPILVRQVKYLNNIVEHPRLIAQRLERVAGVVGPDRVIASTDCGFGTFVGFGRVGAQVAEMKLQAIAEGAALVRA